MSTAPSCCLSFSGELPQNTPGYTLARLCFVRLRASPSCSCQLLSVWCFETVASWQHCIDYKTTKARLSVPGCNTCQPKCLEDRFLPQQTKTQGTAKAQTLQHIVSHLPALLRLPGSVHGTALCSSAINLPKAAEVTLRLVSQEEPTVRRFRSTDFPKGAPDQTTPSPPLSCRTSRHDRGWQYQPLEKIDA